MSIGLLPNISSAAGTPLAQLRGSDVDRAQQDSNVRELRAQSDLKAEQAAGVGQTDGEDHETSDRDADGRQLWQFVRYQNEQENENGPPPEAHVKDPSGQCGNELDLSG